MKTNDTRVGSSHSSEAHHMLSDGSDSFEIFFTHFPRKSRNSRFLQYFNRICGRIDSTPTGDLCSVWRLICRVGQTYAVHNVLICLLINRVFYWPFSPQECDIIEAINHFPVLMDNDLGHIDGLPLCRSISNEIHADDESDILFTTDITMK